MVHYHGGPITPLNIASAVWTGRHAFVSFEYPDQIAFAAEVCQSFALDNGAFSVWRRGATLDVAGYVAWVKEWEKHPGFDWALIPDVIDGTELENDRMFATYREAGGDLLSGVPVGCRMRRHDSAALRRTLEQFGRVRVQHVTEGVQGGHVNALWLALGSHEAVRGRDGDGALALLRQRVGRRYAGAVHQLRQSQSHVQHATKVTPEVGMCTSGFLLADMSAWGYVRYMATMPRKSC